MSDNRKIGILDSGVGGLTVAREVKSLLPNESIIYLGDNANVPYGNKTKLEIYELTKKMVDFLIEKDVKMIAIACNTISSILDEYFLDLDIPIVSIIRPVVKCVDEKNLKNIGVIATEFTINSGVYEKYLLDLDEDLSIVTEGSHSLAAMIDRGDYREEEIVKEVSVHMDSMVKKGKVENVILGCTHYPIVIDRFQKKSPEINFINPAYEQTIYMKNLMEENSTGSDREDSTFEVFTTGKKETYFNMLDNMATKRPDAVYEIEKF